MPAHRLLSPLCTFLYVATIGVQAAHADIYTWTDAAGSVNVSNVAPAAGVHVTGVVRASAQAETARETARQAEVQALENRVRQLEAEAELARQPPPAQVAYRPSPSPPPVIQYIVNAPPAASPLPPPVAYSDPMASLNSGCDFSQIECAFSPGMYPASVVFVPFDRFRSFRPSFRGRPAFPGRPMHVGGLFRTR